MPRVLLVGYYGHGNLGDEAMLEAIAGDLRAAIPDLVLEVVTADPAGTAQHHAARPVPRRNAPALLAAIARADLVLVGGGSLLQDVTSLRNLCYYLGVIALAKAAGKPLMLYANGIGPIASALGRLLVGPVLRRVDRITVRDVESQHELIGLGINRPQAIVAADPALGLGCPGRAPGGDDEGGRRRFPPEAEAMASELGLHPDEPAVAVSLRPWPGMEEWLVALASALRRFHAEEGVRFVLLPMQWPADAAAARPLQAALGPAAVAPTRPPSLREAMGLIAASQMLIGVRFHALVFAAMAGVRPVGLAYDPKVDNFLRSIGLTAAAFDRPDADSLLAALRAAWADRFEFPRRAAAALAEQRERARLPARLAAELLGVRSVVSAPRSAADRR